MNNLKILVCCHNNYPVLASDKYFPIQVGASIADVDLGIQKDNEVNGEATEHISNKNKNYCELTAMYWAWKNYKKIFPNVRYIGTSHYRRFFPELNKKQLCTLQKGVVFIPKLKYYPYSVECAYCIEHERFDIEVLKKVLVELYPDYEKSMLEVFRGNKTTVCNMFIANKDFYFSYCEWMFSILFEVEKRVVINHYNDYQKRIFGFMAERLLYIYLKKNNVKFKQIKINTVNIYCFSYLHTLFNNLRCALAFFWGAKRNYSNV